MNVITILGRISNDIQLSHLKSGEAIAKFNIVWNKRTKDKEDKPNFFKCVAFGRGAELLNQSHKKGDRILIEGELSQNLYEWQGVTRNECQIIVKSLHFVENKYQNTPAQPSVSKPQPTPNVKRVKQSPPIASVNIADDEIPF